MRKVDWDKLSEEKKTYRRAYFRAWKEQRRVQNPNYVRDVNLNRFGLDFGGYTKLVEKQSGLCAICNQPPTRKRHDGSAPILEVDHDYRLGKKKGRRFLLCSQCNTALGLFKENITSLENAIAYLEYFNQKFEKVKE